MRSATLHKIALEYKATPVTLKNLYHFGRAAAVDPAQRLRNAQFLHRELPIRISQRVLELETLPLGMTQTQPIRNLVSWFTDYFYMIYDHPFPTDDRGEETFTEVLTQVLQDPNRVVETICRGALEVKKSPSMMEDSKDVQVAIDSVLSRFYMARIGLRFLIEHHIQSREVREGYAGIIQSRCSPIECVEHAWQEASLICQHHLGEAPELDILQIARDGTRKRNHEQSDMPDIHLTYVPGHLVYMLTEVLKNASRATVEFAEGRKNFKGPIPPIRVIIVDGANDVTIRVSDEGGGITRKNMDRVWSYLHTTAQNSPLLLMTPETEDLTGGSSMPALAGYGVGLPLSRLYARYFGGDLAIKSLEGFGTDAYLHVSRLGQDCENLPDTVQRSPGELSSMLSRGLSNQQ